MNANSPQEVNFEEAQAQMFSCEFCEMFKNSFFAQHHQVTLTICNPTCNNKDTKANV